MRMFKHGEKSPEIREVIMEAKQMGLIGCIQTEGTQAIIGTNV